MIYLLVRSIYKRSTVVVTKKIENLKSTFLAGNFLSGICVRKMDILKQLSLKATQNPRLYENPPPLTWDG